MTPEKAYEEALRRIRETERTGAVELDLSHLAFKRLPPELERLTSLQYLDLEECVQLSGDLSPLAGLTSLQSLNLSGCKQLSGRFAPLESLLPTLKDLRLFGCKLDDLPLKSLASDTKTSWMKSARTTRI
jgi:Leucine-rich repeat (LRR) protein